MNGLKVNAPTAVQKVNDDHPATLAKAFLEHGNFGQSDANPNIRYLRHWREDFYMFVQCVYYKLIPEQFEADVDRFLEMVDVGNDKASRKLRVTDNTLREVVKKLRRLCQIDAPAMPTWLDSGRTNPSDVIAFQNGMVYANRLGNEREPIQMEPPSPAWFSETALPCDFGHHFACPRWLKFLQSTLGQDRDGEELIGLLQEWFGYCLTGDTSQQKMLWLHGRSGAGKGTITKILQRTLGDRNCVSFSLWDLDRPFTLSSFLGKTLAISQDAHLEDSKDSARLLEQIKAITGEDDRFVDIKNRDPLAGVRLRTRFTISVNNFPPLRDVGDTLRRRLMIIPFEKSFAGNEDSGLLEKLTCEIPGIARWAIEGLRRLRQRGRFPETRKGLQMLDRFRRESNPFFEFIEDCCETPEPASWPKEKPEPVCTKESLYRAYKAWSKWSNDPRTKSRSWFHRDLRHSVPSICEHRPENDRSRRVRYYRWIRLNELGDRFLHDMEISDTDEAEMFASNQA